MRNLPHSTGAESPCKSAVILPNDADIFGRICEDLKKNRTAALHLHQPRKSVTERRHVARTKVFHPITAANALGRSVMGAHDAAERPRATVAYGQLAEDAAPAIVEQQNAQIASQTTVPERIAVVEETEVADDAEHGFVSNEREAGRRGKRTLDAVHPTVTIDVMACIYVGQADGHAVGIVDYWVMGDG